MGPAGKPFISSVVAPFDQKKVYGVLPPETVIFTAPLFAPPHEALVIDCEKFIGIAELTVTVFETAVQPEKS